MAKRKPIKPATKEELDKSLATLQEALGYGAKVQMNDLPTLRSSD